MTIAEEHFRRRQLEFEKLTGEENLSGIRAPPPTATSILTATNGAVCLSDEGKKNFQLISDNRKLIANLEQVQMDLEKRVLMNSELTLEIKNLKDQLNKVTETLKERNEKEEKIREEMKVCEFRLKKARDEIVELKGRVKELSSVGKGDGGFELKRENGRLKKLIAEKILPLLRRKSEVIKMYQQMSQLRQGSDELNCSLRLINLSN